MVTCTTYIVCVWPSDSHCRIGIRIGNFSNQNPKLLFFSIAMRIFLGPISLPASQNARRFAIHHDFGIAHAWFRVGRMVAQARPGSRQLFRLEGWNGSRPKRVVVPKSHVVLPSSSSSRSSRSSRSSSVRWTQGNDSECCVTREIGLVVE